VAFQIYSEKSNRWRDAYNPLRGMSLPKLLSLLDAGERGQYADLQWFYHFMERSDAMVFSVMQRRRAALLACDWDIKQVPEQDFSRRGAEYAESSPPASLESQRHGEDGRKRSAVSVAGIAPTNIGTIPATAGSGRRGDAVLAEEQAALLREAYERIENLRDAVGFMFSGFFRGFAHLEKHFAESGMVTRLEPGDQLAAGSWQASAIHCGAPLGRGLDHVAKQTPDFF
jgi:hypothetical protein